VVTSRLCLDQIRSARSRRERAHDPGVIEAVAPPVQPVLADPADRVTFDDSVHLAVLVVLQRLTPAERVVFVLHDIFQMPFDTVAHTVGRNAQACRQLATRARQKISASGDARFDVTAAEHRLVTGKFIAAAANGDLSGLVEVLAPGAWGDIDYGPAATRPKVVVTGAGRVARHLLHYWGPAAALVSHPVAGQPALLGFHDRQLSGVLVFTMHDEKIQTVHVIADPAKLAFLNAQLAASA
jgi:RNA polymerase sigma-70 factor (ECF subfamily)